MNADRVEEVTSWESRSFDGGHAGLGNLAQEEFTGAVTDGDGWLLFLSGRVVGVSGGTVESFADADGTAYAAPHASLPLLFAMQEVGGDVRARYYTNDTPLAEADETLESGNFTGYVELSEHVHSGDYYVVYHRGDSLTSAFVGNNRQLKTGDEAFSLANEEVGIYKVYDVDLEIREIPGTDTSTEPAGQRDAVTESTAATGAGSSDSDSDTDTDSDTGLDLEATIEELTEETPGETSDALGESDEMPDGQAGSGRAPDMRADELSPEGGSTQVSEPTSSTDPSLSPESTSQAANTEDTEPDTEEPATTVEPESESVDQRPEVTTPDQDRRDDRDPASNAGTGQEPGVSAAKESHTDTESTESGNADASETASQSQPSAATQSAEQPSATPDSEPASDGETQRDPSADAGQQENVRPDEDVFSEEAQWRETRSIPALDPEETTTQDARKAESESIANDESEVQGTRKTAAAGGSTEDANPPSADWSVQESPSSDGDSGVRPDADGSATTQSDRQGEAESTSTASVERLQAALEKSETRREELLAERDSLAAERDEHAREAQRLESELAELEATVDRLEAEIADAGDGSAPESMSPNRALSGTNFFVRYDSKGEPTLEEAHDGDANKDDIESNLRIEHHTIFDTEGLSVNGTPFSEWLHRSIQYSFAEWLVRDLLFEIRDTGHAGELLELYDAIPHIDRAEINGEAEVTIEEDGEQKTETREFDIVFRDRMGAPLFLAELNGSREPTPEVTLHDLVTGAKVLRESNPSVAAAFGVTESFFEPGALETAEDATSGGLLSRNSQKSYVKLSRKEGFHLCLIEYRDGEFHLNVPEL